MNLPATHHLKGSAVTNPMGQRKQREHMGNDPSVSCLHEFSEEKVEQSFMKADQWRIKSKLTNFVATKPSAYFLY